MPTLPPPLLHWFNDFIAAHLGLNFSPQRFADLARGIDSAMVEFGFDDPAACINWLSTTPLTRPQIEILASHLTVGETYFFRERQVFRAFEEHVLPQLIDERRERPRRLRIWSAGCCTGEEPYSLAIALARSLHDLGDWDVTILATDINPRFLKKAAAGVFSEWSFRDVPAAVKEQYFSRTESGAYALRPALKRLVTFDYLNLAEDHYPSAESRTEAMDVIFCRNVLIYLGAEHAGRVADRMERCLAEGGWMFVGAAETSHFQHSRLAAVVFPGAIVYQKPRAAGVRCEETARDAAIWTSSPGPIPTAPWEPPFARIEVIPRVEPSTAALQITEPAAGSNSHDDHHADGPPSEPQRLATLAQDCAGRGRLSEALGWCEQALAADRLDPGLHYLRAMILLEFGQPQEAARALSRAIYLDPGFVMAHVALGHLLDQQGRPDKASRHRDQVLRLLRDYPADQALPESENLTVGRLAKIIAETPETEMAG